MASGVSAHALAPSAWYSTPLQDQNARDTGSPSPPRVLDSRQLALGLRLLGERVLPLGDAPHLPRHEGQVAQGLHGDVDVHHLPQALTLPDVKGHHGGSVVLVPVSQFFTSGGQSIGASPSSSVLPVNNQGWFSFDWFDLLAFQGTLKSLLQHHNSLY